MRGFHLTGRARLRSASPGIALAVAALLGAAAPSAHASKVDKTLVNTCALFSFNAATGKYTNTGATIKLSTRIQATAPDSIAQGAAATLTDAKATASLDAAAVGVASGFGQSFIGEATQFDIGLTGAQVAGGSSVLNAAATPIPYPRQAVTPDPGYPTTSDAEFLPIAFDVPSTGTLPPLGPLTATGAVGTEIVGRFNGLSASVTFTKTGVERPYELRCTPDARLFDADGNDIGAQDSTLARVPITSDPGQDVPRIISIAPQAGEGGTVVTVTGANLGSVTGVKFGPLSAQFAILSSTQVRAIAPPAGPGVGTVQVTASSPSGVSVTNPDATFTYVASPPPTRVTALSPASGPSDGGIRVTITGTSLASATGVKFGTNQAVIESKSDTSLVVISPAGIPGAKVDVTVIDSLGQTSVNTAADDYVYIGDSFPRITSLTPNSGTVAGGTEVSIRGIWLAGGRVTFGGVAATVVSSSDTLIKVLAPPAPAGKVDVVVAAGMGVSANTVADDFTYLVPPAGKIPTIRSLFPNVGLAGVGGVTTISGTNFKAVKSVRFGAANAASFFVLNATTIVAVAPKLRKGAYPVTVTNALGDNLASSAARYTYLGF